MTNAMPVTEQLSAFMTEGFSRHAVAKTGVEGRKTPVSFVEYEGTEIIGGIIVALFWGQLHIKNLMVHEKHRGKGLATRLMQQAHDYGRQQGCDFAFVETLSFQAPDFYTSLGYVPEFTRPGYAANTSFVYMKKDLKKP